MVAETGTLVVVESEGNGRMCLTLPETLISVVGIEKVVPTWQDLEVFLHIDEFIAGKLWLLHSNVYDYVGNRQAVSEEGRRRYNEVFTSTRYETEHPLVHVHPETGERALILGHFAQKVIGYGTTDSAHLLAIFQEHIIRPENTVRWRWSAGDVAIWDNRATQHRAIDDYGERTAGGPARHDRRRTGGQRRWPAQLHQKQGSRRQGRLTVTR